jgi:Fe-S cluster assembly iron-binding protein IscA
MFTITEKALEMASEHMKGMDKEASIRVYLNQGG